MLWIEEKYVGFLSPRLRNFKHVDRKTWNFSCPLCGDSKKKKFKARGYIYQNKDGNGLVFHCHNCSQSMAFPNLIKELDSSLYSSFIRERMLERDGEKPVVVDPVLQFRTEKPQFAADQLEGIERISDLPETHPAVVYIANRHIPKKHWDNIYYTVNFFKWVDRYVPGKYKQRESDDPRIVIPFTDADGQLTGVTGRTMVNAEPRYVIAKIVSSATMIYGLSGIAKDYQGLIYALEGSFDAMFLSTAIAAAGGDITSDLSRLPLSTDRFVVVYDNEPRNPHIVRQTEKAIERGYKVCIWPNYVTAKDVNEMVELLMTGGVTVEKASEDIESIIAASSFSGLTAKLAFSNWRKC